MAISKRTRGILAGVLVAAIAAGGWLAHDKIADARVNTACATAQACGSQETPQQKALKSAILKNMREVRAKLLGAEVRLDALTKTIQDQLRAIDSADLDLDDADAQASLSGLRIHVHEVEVGLGPLLMRIKDTEAKLTALKATGYNAGRCDAIVAGNATLKARVGELGKGTTSILQSMGR